MLNVSLNSETPWSSGVALKIISALGGSSNTLVVGGAVRNWLLDENVNDIDLATKILPEKSMKLLSDIGLNVKPIGLDHGTIAVYEDEKIVDGFFETDKLSSYMDSSQFSDIVDSILGIIEPSGSIVKNCIRLGGCEYLEEKLKNKNEVEMNRDYFGSIVDPTWDSKNMFEWVQMSCYEGNFRDELKKLNDDGFIIVSSTDFSSEKSRGQFNVFNFRKLRSENI